MSGYSGCASERISPGPAPGSPVASVKFGPRATRTSPFYGSLKKVKKPTGILFSETDSVVVDVLMCSVSG